MTHHSVMEITQVLWHHFLIMTLIWVTFMQLIYYSFNLSYVEFKLLFSANRRMFWILIWFWYLPANLFSFNSSICFGCCLSYCSVTQSCLTLCSPIDCSMPGFPVLQHLLEFAQTHVHWVGDAIQPSHRLSSPSPPTFSLSQHQGLF